MFKIGRKRGGGEGCPRKIAVRVMGFVESPKYPDQIGVIGELVDPFAEKPVRALIFDDPNGALRSDYVKAAKDAKRTTCFLPAWTRGFSTKLDSGKQVTYMLQAEDEKENKKGSIFVIRDCEYIPAKQEDLSQYKEVWFTDKKHEKPLTEALPVILGTFVRVISREPEAGDCECGPAFVNTMKASSGKEYVFLNTLPEEINRNGVPSFTKWDDLEVWARDFFERYPDNLSFVMRLTQKKEDGRFQSLGGRLSFGIAGYMREKRPNPDNPRDNIYVSVPRSLETRVYTFLCWVSYALQMTESELRKLKFEAYGLQLDIIPFVERQVSEFAKHSTTTLLVSYLMNSPEFNIKEGEDKYALMRFCYWQTTADKSYVKRVETFGQRKSFCDPELYCGRLGPSTYKYQDNSSILVSERDLPDNLRMLGIPCSDTFVKWKEWGQMWSSRPVPVENISSVMTTEQEKAPDEMDAVDALEGLPPSDMDDVPF